MYLFSLFLVLYEFTTYAANDMIMPGMLQVVHNFQVPEYFVALSLSCYILGNSIFVLFAGFFSERYGKRNIILIGNFLFFIFTIAIIFSKTIHEFMTWRLLQGAGLSIIAIGYAFIHQYFDDKTAIKLAALMANVSILAPLIGPLLGAGIISYSSWEYVFVLTALLSIITWVGLYFSTPKDTVLSPVNTFSETTKQYFSILKNKEFLQGMLCSVFAVMTLLIWISQAPNLILFRLKLDFTHYVIYQLISIGGLTFSSMLMQFIVGRYKLYSIVKIGNILLLLGLTISLLGSNSMIIISMGLFVYALGMGLANGCIMRLIMSIKGYSHGMLAAMFSFMQTLLFAVGIAIMNEFFSYYQFSLLSFTISSFVFGVVAFVLTAHYMLRYRYREWH